MEGYKELLDQLSGLIRSLENGELSMEELNAMESVTRKLHERSIILRYKAFESSVVKEENESSEEESTSNDVLPMTENEQESEPMVANQAVESEAAEPEEETAFDFAIFDEEEESEVKDEPFQFETSVEETVEEIDSSIEDEEEIAIEPEVAEPTLVEPETVDEVKTVIEPVEPPQPMEEVKVETSEIPPVPTPESATTSGGSFLDRFSQQDNSVAGRFSARPLDSLIGAFGLNERLRFINDLFDGSSEKFSDAIKALDSQSDLDAAKAKAASYAEENEWDPDEEVVAEFMNYLNRRYA